MCTTVITLIHFSEFTIQFISAEVLSPFVHCCLHLLKLSSLLPFCWVVFPVHQKEKPSTEKTYSETQVGKKVTSTSIQSYIIKVASSADREGELLCAFICAKFIQGQK